jgi:starch synthase
MEILMVAAELGPYARASDAGDAVLALAKALRQLGHNVTLALPRYPTFEAHGLLVARRLTPLSIGEGREVTVFDGQLSSGVALVLFDVPGLFDEPAILEEGAAAPQNLERADTLCRAAGALVRQRTQQGKRFDVVHLHDWPAALVPHYAGEGAPPCVLTVHDVRRQGRFEAALPAGGPPQAEEGRGVCLLRAGVALAREVVTVSPTYAATFSDDEAAGPLAEVFAARSAPATGVALGIDYALYNPATDPALDSRYNAEDPSNKGRTKAAVLRQLGLELEVERPLVVYSGDLDEEHGADLVLAALPELSRQDVAVAIAGRGDPELEQAFARERNERQGDVAFAESPDEVFLRRLNAAADFVLVPSRYEPCGTRQLVAQRYGALPIARAVGGLIDTVVDVDPELETGTGFLFDSDDPAELVGAVERAISAYVSPSWPRLRRRVMRLDLSWDRPARRYVQIYREAIGS